MLVQTLALGQNGAVDVEEEKSGTLVRALELVRDGDVLAARRPEYYVADLAQKMSEQLILHEDFGHYEKAPDIGKVGFPYYDTVYDVETEAAYWEQAMAWNRKLRKTHWPMMSPIDRVHIELDEAWPHGTRLLHDAAGRAAFAGLARVFQAGAQALPHVDRLEWDAPKNRFDFTPVAQIAMNVYLRMPEKGGEVAIWAKKPDQQEHQGLRIPGSYGLNRELLGDPDLVIRPQQGDLLFFDAQNVHAVFPSEGGERVTVSFFILIAPNGAMFIYS